ncbi:MAG: DUF2939 domain-containing protein [Alphaproteobacteria bacterium]
MPARIFTAVVLLLAVVWAAWPYGNLWFFGQAVDAGDEARMEQAVDWQSVRNHLKNDVRQRLSAELAGQGEADEPGQAIARQGLMLLGAAIAEGLIDAYATPEALLAVLNEIADAGEGEGEFFDTVSYAFFAAPTRFRVHVRPPDSGDKDEPLGLIFSFQDFNWVLTRIELPLDELKEGKPEQGGVEPNTEPGDQER